MLYKLVCNRLQGLVCLLFDQEPLGLLWFTTFCNITSHGSLVYYSTGVCEDGMGHS